MIQMLINLGKWLESRFPKQVVVLEQDYQQLKSRLENVENEFVKIPTIVSRIGYLETTAVHKEPVKLLVEEMAKFKAELASLRAGLGITATGASSPESLEAMLNGEFIKQGGSSNG
jgi:hypothetical protein